MSPSSVPPNPEQPEGYRIDASKIDRERQFAPSTIELREMEFTCGAWPDEQASAQAFDGIMSTINLFKIYREVCGTYIDPVGPEPTKPRIDRILIPSERLTQAGWNSGAIGVELKRSGEKIGPPLAQCRDYIGASFPISAARINVRLSYVFLWPARKMHCSLASFQAHFRLGSACPNLLGHGSLIYFYVGEQELLRVGQDGIPQIKIVTSGNKNGRR
jgi:hypothetical protein